MSSANQPATRSAASLGKVTYETKPNTSNLVAGVILALLLVGGGLGLTIHMCRQMFFGGGNPPQNAGDWGGALLIAGLGIALTAGGIYLFLWVRSLFGFRLRVCAAGFSFTKRGIESVYAWDEIQRVRETVSHEKLPLAKGLARHAMPTKTSRSYSVVRCDGEEFYFDDNVIARASLLAGPLAAAAKNRNIAWESVEQQG